jgi:8-oxo-dGTP pyrophosphatase MutT (NUDIX family)
MAAVLVPLVFSEELRVIFTLRAQTLAEHAGEICFPGGRPEAADGSLEVTAMREANEELGLSELRLLGSLSTVPVYTSRYRLVPYVAQVEACELRANPQEVEKILMADVQAHLRAPAIDGIPFEFEGKKRFSPVFDLEGHRLYGATAHVFHELLTLLAPLLKQEVPPFRKASYRFEELLGASTTR